MLISLVTAERHDAAYAVHRASLGDFVLPLAADAFRQIVAARQLFAVEHGGEIAGLCYVKPDNKNLDDVPRWELGGAYVTPALRGRSVGPMLSTVAIAAAISAEPRPVMTYVHQDHRDVLGQAIGRLGFVRTGQTLRLGPGEARGYLRRDANGFAVADVLQLPEAALTRVADDLELLADDSLQVADTVFPSGRHEVVRRLREAAGIGPAA